MGEVDGEEGVARTKRSLQARPRHFPLHDLSTIALCCRLLTLRSSICTGWDRTGQLRRAGREQAMGASGRALHVMAGWHAGMFT